MKNISWGTKIAVLYIGFALLILTLVALSLRQKIDLVNDDYYSDELKFQDKINEMNNANALTEKITHEIVDDKINIKFPELFKDKTIEGEIEFYRPSDNTKDYKQKIEMKSNLIQSIELKNLSKGMYKMKINWVSDKTPYFIEEIIVLP